MRRHVRFQWVFCLVLLSIQVGVQAQTAPAPTPSLEKEFLKNILKDQKAIWTSPLHLEREDAKWMIPGAIGFGALITTDRITGDEIAEFDRAAKASRIVSYPGSLYGVGAVAGVFYLVGRKKNDARARETGILISQAAVDSLIVSSALKAVSQRARPDAVRERSEFFDGGTSFPSGHSIQAWSMASVIASEYRDKPKVQFAAYAVASAVSVARFTSGKHYVSDVIVGSVLGFTIGRYVYHTHHRQAQDSFDDENGPTLSKWPTISPQYSRAARSYGVSVKWNF